MPQFVNKQTGRLVNLEGDDGLRAVAAGTHTPVEGTVATELGGVTPEDYTANIQGGLSNPEAADPLAERALEQQLHFEERYGGGGNAALAFGEGALGGLTFGGSDVLLDALGADTAERALANPGARFAGELGGAAVSSLAGGAGTLGAAARLTPAGAAVAGAGRIGKAVGGAKGLLAATAIEGAAFGAGTSVSQLVIHDVPLTSEAALPEIGFGALLGAGAGLAGGALALGVGKVASRLESRTSARAAREAEETLSPLVNEGTFKPFAHEAKNLTTKFGQSVDDALDTAARTAQGLPVTGSPGQLRTWAVARHQALVEEANNAISAARSINLGEPAIAKLNGSLRNSTKLAELAEGTTSIGAKNFNATGQVLNRLEGDLRKLVGRIDGKLGQTGSWDTIATKLDDLDNGFHALTGSGQVAPRTAYSKGTSPVGVTRAPDPELSSLVSEVKAAQTEFRSAWGLTNKDTLTETAFKRFANLNQEQMTKAGTSWAAYQDAAKRLATKLPDAELAGAINSSADEFSGVLKGLVPAEQSGQRAIDLMDKLGLVAAGADVADIDLPGPAEDIAKIWLLHRFLAKGGGAVMGKSMPSELGRMLAGGPGGSPVNKLAKTYRAVTGGVMDGTSNLATITGKALARIEGATSKIARGVEKTARKGTPGAATILNKARFWDSDEVYTRSDDMYTAFKKRSTEVARAAADPMATHQKVFDSLTEVRASHPLVADQVEMATMRAVQFLYEKMPKDPGTVQSFGKSRWKPSEQEITKWANYVSAVQDPIGVVENASNGVVTPQSAEALRTVYPRLFQEAQLLLMTRAEDLQKNTTFEQQGRLSILFGVPVNSAYRPDVTKFNAAQWAARTETDQPIDTSKLKPEQPSNAQTLLG